MSGNSADSGGAIYSLDRYGSSYPSPLWLINCTFAGNSATTDAGCLYAYRSGPSATNCVFKGSSSGGDGGVVVNREGEVTFTNCVFRGNSSGGDGGVMLSSEGPATFSGCVFQGNASGGYGGVMRCIDEGDTTLAHCTLSGNTAESEGGGIYKHGWSSLSVANSVFWANADVDGMNETAQIQVGTPFTPIVDHSCVQGGWSGSGDGNIEVDPLFARTPDPGPDGEWDGVDDDLGDLRLQPLSPCINTGDPEFVPEPGQTDVDGHPRVLCDRADMGAYEYGMGDTNCDRSVDLTDFAEWTPCLTGPGGGPIESSCTLFDFDNDNDVDLGDFAGFMEAYTGSIMIASKAAMIEP